MLFLLICLGCSFSTYGQSRSQLEKKRKQLIEQIRTNNQLLTTTKSTKEATLSDLAILKQQISQRQELISVIQQEINLMDKEALELEASVTVLENDLARLKADYQQMMRHAYRYKNRHQRLMFLLSAESFNNASKRWQYLKHYDAKRKEQVNKIVETQHTITAQLDTINAQKTTKVTLLATTQNQKEQLQTEKKEKDRVLKELERQEAKLAATLTQQRKAKKDLTDKIDELIRIEMEKSRKSGRTPTTEKAEVVIQPMSDKEKKIAEGFVKNKKKLPMPVKGVITERFGRQPHPTIKGVYITNNGINIKTSSNAKARSIYAGTVSSVFFVPGNQKAVMIKHGDYYTVYSNLKKVDVEKGQQVNKGQVIGLVGRNKQNNQVELHFELWKNNNRQNPELWLKTR